MWAFSVLDRYIGKITLTTITITLFMLIMLSGIIKFVDQLKITAQSSYGVLEAGMYTLFSAAKDIQIFFPMAALIGVIIGLGILAQRNELVAMQASGYTRIQITLSVMKVTIPLALLAMAINEWVSPVGEQNARNYRAKAIYGDSLFATKRRAGLWVKDGQNFIHIACVKNVNKLIGINIFSLNKNHRLQSIRYVATAKFDPKHKLWRLLQINELNLQNSKQIINSQTVSSTWKINLTPDKLSTLMIDTDALSISDLYNCVTYLKLSGQDAGRYQLDMWSKIFQPILVAVMMLMALAFSLGPLQNVLIGGRVFTGIIFGFFFYVLDQIFGQLTLIYSIPSILGALLPSALFFLISLWLLLKRS